MQPVVSAQTHEFSVDSHNMGITVTLETLSTSYLDSGEHKPSSFARSMPAAF